MYVACIYDPRSLTLMHVCMMHISMILDHNHMYPWCMMHVSMILDPDTCMYDVHMFNACVYDAYMYINDPWSWYMYPWCMYLWSLILDPDTCVYDVRMYDAYIWPWFIYLWLGYPERDRVAEEEGLGQGYYEVWIYLFICLSLLVLEKFQLPPLEAVFLFENNIETFA